MKRFVQVGFFLFVMSGLARAELKSAFKKENLQLLVEGFSFVERADLGWEGEHSLYLAEDEPGHSLLDQGWSSLCFFGNR